MLNRFLSRAHPLPPIVRHCIHCLQPLILLASIAPPRGQTRIIKSPETGLNGGVPHHSCKRSRPVCTQSPPRTHFISFARKTRPAVNAGGSGKQAEHTRTINDSLQSSEHQSLEQVSQIVDKGKRARGGSDRWLDQRSPCSIWCE